MQETLLAAWRGLERFEGRASVRALALPDRDEPLPERAARPGAPPTGGAAMVEPPEPTRRAEPIWLEPYPDVLLEASPTAPRAGGPLRGRASRSGSRSSSRSSSLPPRQRAVLVLRDVLGFRDRRGRRHARHERAVGQGRAAARAGDAPGAGCRPPTASARRCRTPPRERELVGRFADAVESGDVDDVVALLTDDALLTMPPQPLEYQGHDGDRRLPPSPRGAARRGRCASCRPAPTPSRRSAATSPTRTRRSPAPTE